MSVHMATNKIILALVLAAWLSSMAFAMTPAVQREGIGRRKNLSHDEAERKRRMGDIQSRINQIAPELEPF
jgi:hypothetical protein